MTSSTTETGASLADVTPHTIDRTNAHAFAPEYRQLRRSELRPLWQRVARPGRYTGGEFGIPERDPGQAQVRALLLYADTYELGMSNQGLKILYDVINRHPGYLADRAFLPEDDFANELRAAGLPLYSLDHFLDARSFDFWGFNTATELGYTNILYALDLAGIPLLRTQRTARDPFIITGGTAVSNPFPLFDFLDGIFMGDGEEAVLEIGRTIADGRAQRKTRAEILRDLSGIEGLIVPEEYTVEVDANPAVYPRYSGPTVRKRDYRGSAFAALENIVVPSVEIVQDRVVVEVARGCGQGCRFCHAGFWKRPVRNAEVDTLVKVAGEMLAKTGSDSVSLHSLSLADYPWLEELVVSMAGAYGESGISLSLPSLRVQVKTIPVLEMTSNIRRSSVTFALEAGTELMRERIRKKSSEENLHYLVREVFARGWDLVKVYFMMGLPDRDGGEVDGLIRALNALGDLATECGPRKRVNVTVSLFVPKPFTTFQWEKQQTPDYFYDGLKKIKAGLRTNRVNLSGPEPHMAYVEGLLSRSDHRMGAIILKAYERGARFDSWDDRFQRRVWEEIFAEIPAELRALWMEQKPGGTALPWHDIITGKGAGIELLSRDFQKFENVTPENMNPPHPQQLTPSDFPAELLKPVRIPEHKFQTRTILAIEFARRDPFIYISHLEIADTIRRACRRAGLPMTFSQGFNKHEKFHFVESLPLFIESELEVLYVELYDTIDLIEAHRKLRKQLPAGLQLLTLSCVDQLPSQREADARLRSYRLEFADASLARRAAEKLRNAPAVVSYERRIRKRKLLKKLKRGQKPFTRVERQLGDAIRNLVATDRTIVFDLEPPIRGAISIADLVTHYLQIPVECWNTDIKIIKTA